MYFRCYLLVSLALIPAWVIGALFRPCSVPFLINGRANLRQRGRFLRYTCNSGYDMVGNRYTGCQAGQWDSPVPICTKKGCSPLLRSSGDVNSIDQWASAYLDCQPGFEVAGSKWTYCNGTDWDRELGKCRETKIGPALYCDFEHEDICEWTAINSHEFNWKRFNNVERLYGLEHSKGFTNKRSGPKHDHTTMGKDGYFMVAQSTAFTPNEKARLLSPLYPAKRSIDSCFRFYFFMYGRLSGWLRVFYKPESMSLDNVITDPNYKLTEIAGNYRNAWKEELVHLRQQTEEFQIVIEAMSGYSAYTDIAIDDVALLSGADCGFLDNSTPTEDSVGVYDQESCSNRCNEPKPKSPGIEEEHVANQTGVLVRCDCFDGCEDNGSCCNDYLSFCDLGEYSTTESLIVTEVKETEPTKVPITTPNTSTTSTVLVSTAPATTPTTVLTSKATVPATNIPTKLIPLTSTAKITRTSKYMPTKISTTTKQASITTSSTTRPTVIVTKTSPPPTSAITTSTPASTSSTTISVPTRSYLPAVTTTEQQILNFASQNQSPTSSWALPLAMIGLAFVTTFVLAGVIIRFYSAHRITNAVEEVRYLIDNEDVLL